MDQSKGWDITVDGIGAVDAMRKFNEVLHKLPTNFGTARRLQRAAVELMVGAGNTKNVRIVCSGNGHGYLALSVSTTEVQP